MMVFCPTCGNDVGDAKFCSKCGSEITDADENSKKTKFCSNCGQSIDINAEICPNCGMGQNVGNAVAKTTKYCSNCAAEIDINAEICPRCGVRQMSSSFSSGEKNVWVAVVLSLLVVGLGHFYLGLPKKGAMLVILSVISWILIFVVIGIIIYPIVIIYGIYDVYKSAVALSEGRHVEDELFR